MDLIWYDLIITKAQGREYSDRQQFNGTNLSKRKKKKNNINIVITVSQLKQCYVTNLVRLPDSPLPPTTQFARCWECQCPLWTSSFNTAYHPNNIRNPSLQDGVCIHSCWWYFKWTCEKNWHSYISNKKFHCTSSKNFGHKRSMALNSFVPILQIRPTVLVTCPMAPTDVRDEPTTFLQNGHIARIIL